MIWLYCEDGVRNKGRSGELVFAADLSENNSANTSSPLRR
jgi:hypothetical protein